MDSTPESPRRTWAEIDTDALRHNFDALQACVGASVQVMAVVKANAYGHGVETVVKALASRAAMFGVANVKEAREVRVHAPGVPVFILGPALPDERAEIVWGGFIPSVSDVAEARAYAALGTGAPIPVHLVLDTGMGRIGIWEDDAERIAHEICSIPGIDVAGIASHLPVADEDAGFTHDQLLRFHTLVEKLVAQGIRRPVVHVENSAGIIAEPALAGTLVRAGLALYGSAPIVEFQPKLRPVMTWKTRVTLIREVGVGRGVSYGRTFITPRPMRIATLAVGYADGYRRHLSHCEAHVLIGGKRCSLLGRVTMDQILVDVSALPECQAGDEVVLIGQQGSEEILAAELAEKSGTIAWDIFTGIGQRVVRT